METIVASVITGCITLAGVLIANGKAQAVMERKVKELTREVRAQNHFAHASLLAGLLSLLTSVAGLSEVQM